MDDLKCPECACRIGNSRSTCASCNRFAQRVMRVTRTRLKALHAADYDRIRAEVEAEVYADLNRSTATEAK